MSQPPVCNYEGSDYQVSFWDRGERQYEDRTEAIALRRLLPAGGGLLLELGAGAGRNTPRYRGFDRIVLVDYSHTQLQQAQARLGAGDRYIYVAADIYRLPFAEGCFDTATMIRTLHHMVDAPRALSQVRSALAPGAIFILEFANKLNLKAILRYLLGKQAWNPFTLQPVEFAALNFDFHPVAVRHWLSTLGFRIERILTVSHFRSGILKRMVSVSVLVWLDSLFQWTGALWQFTPSVFVRAALPGAPARVQFVNVGSLFRCPDCGHAPLIERDQSVDCSQCGHQWPKVDGIYDFRAQPSST